jgi:acyl-CoA reductase-like NAD-dependent aldehyde dehydrogenase
MAAVPDDLDAAVRAFRAAQDEVPDAQAAARQLVADARAKVEQKRAELAAAIVRAARAGVRQRDLVAVTGYNRESIRRILRAGGVEPDDS